MSQFKNLLKYKVVSLKEWELIQSVVDEAIAATETQSTDQLKAALEELQAYRKGDRP